MGRTKETAGFWCCLATSVKIYIQLLRETWFTINSDTWNWPGTAPGGEGAGEQVFAMSQVEAQMQHDLRAAVVVRAWAQPSWHPASPQTIPEPKARFSKSPFSGPIAIAWVNNGLIEFNLPWIQSNDFVHTAMVPNISLETDSYSPANIQFPLPIPQGRIHSPVPPMLALASGSPLSIRIYVEVSR